MNNFLLRFPFLLLLSTSVLSFDLGNGGVFNQSPEQRSYWAQRFGSGFLSALSRHQVRQRNERHITPHSRTRSSPRLLYVESTNPDKDQETFFTELEKRNKQKNPVFIPMPAQVFSVPAKKINETAPGKYDMKIVQYVYLNKGQAKKEEIQSLN